MAKRRRQAPPREKPTPTASTRRPSALSSRFRKQFSSVQLNYSPHRCKFKKIKRGPAFSGDRDITREAEAIFHFPLHPNFSCLGFPLPLHARAFPPRGRLLVPLNCDWSSSHALMIMITYEFI